MPKNIQVAICNRIDEVINVKLHHDQVIEQLNTRICAMHDLLSDALTEEHNHLIEELDTLHTDLETYYIDKAYRIGLSDGMQIGGGTA